MSLKKKIQELEEHTIRSRANCCENADSMFPCIEECDRVFLWKDDVSAVLSEAAKQIHEIFDDTDKRAGDYRVISVVRGLKKEVLAILEGNGKEKTKP